jgi:hypothetical protein
MDLWSDDPAERIAAARDPQCVADWPSRIGATAPVQPWPYGMPTSINPFIVFLGASPGNSPPLSDPRHRSLEPYDLPTTGIPHWGITAKDKRHYWDRVRDLGTYIIRARSPQLSDEQAQALLGQLNLGTGQFGQARNAPFEADYCRWVPAVILDLLRPAYVLLFGMQSRLRRAEQQFDPLGSLGIDWNAPDECFPFSAYKASNYKFRIWRVKRPDGRIMRVVQWPQHPSRAPMTNPHWWQESGREFVLHVEGWSLAAPQSDNS